MNTAELKNDLIKVIVNTDDITFLQQVMNFFKTHQVTTDWWDDISEEEKALIEEGAKDVEEGRVVPYAEVKAEIKQILNKN